MRILLVDDEDIVLQGLSMLINSRYPDFEIKTASNGKLAIDIIDKYIPDIVVVDVRMPVMDGLELCQRLKNMNHRAKKIIISGYKDFEYARKAIEVNAESYILKPISQEKFLDVFKRIVEDIEVEERKEKVDVKKKILAERKALEDLLRFEESDLNNQKLKNIEEVLTFDAPFLIGVIRIDDADIIKQDVKKELLPDISTKARGIVEDFISNSKIHITFTENNYSEYVFLASTSKSSAETILKELSLAINKELHVSSIYAASRPIPSLLNIKTAYKECITSLKIPLINSKCESEHIVYKAMDIISKRFKYVTLNTVAEELNISPTYLSRLLKKSTGHNFKDIVTEKRIRVAKILLRNSAMKTFEIAERIGYSDPKYFFKMFKKKTGVTPVEYRKKHI